MRIQLFRRNRGYPPWLARLLGPGDPEISCEECIDALDRYVELELTGANADAAFPGMRPHLAGCPACGEDHEVLLSFLRRESRRGSPRQGRFSRKPNP